MTYNKFAVQLPKDRIYKQALMATLTEKYPWITVAGLDAPFTTNTGRNIRGVQYAGYGDYLTVGTAKSHDVNWTSDLSYIKAPGIVPVFDLKRDFNTVMRNFAILAEARKPKYPTRTNSNLIFVGGKAVEIYDNFIKVGNTIVPRFADESTFARYTTIELKRIETAVISIKLLF